MMKKYGKTILSVLLTLALLLSAVPVFSLGAGALTYPDVSFVVPEAIYLAPDYDAYSTSGEYSFQWYVNNTLTSSGAVTPDVSASQTGRISFRYAGASAVSISFRWQMTPGSNISSTSTISFGNGIAKAPGAAYEAGLTSGAVTTTITSGTTPAMSATQTGLYICWTATFTDVNDGIQKQVEAYTYVYKPFVYPIAVANRSINTCGDDFYGSNLSWISGVHDVAFEREGAKYPRTDTTNGFLPFASSASGMQSDALCFQMPAYFYTQADNSSPGNWLADSGSASPKKSAYYFASTTSSHSGYLNNDYIINYAYSSTGLLTVDTSRYTNLNQVPNLSVGLMVTDDASSDSGGAWFVSNFTAHSSVFEFDHTDYWKIGNDGDLEQYWDPMFECERFAGVGDRDNLIPDAEKEGVKVNRPWSRTLSSASSSIYYVGAGFTNKENNDRIYNLAELRCQVNTQNKAELRSAVNYAIAAGAVVNRTVVSDTAAWNRFKALYNYAQMSLTKLDGTYTSVTINGTTYATMNALAVALQTKTDELKSISGTYTVNYDGNGATGGSMSPSTHTTGAAKKLSPNAFTRNFNVIFDPNYDNEQTTTVTVTSTFNGWNTKADGSGTSYANQASVTNLAAAGGSITLYAQWTAGATTLPALERTGYQLVGWYSDAALTTLAGQGGAAYVPTANITLYAKWTTNTYTVHFDGNGATGGSMSNQTFTYDVPQALTANAFTRVNTVTFNQNYTGCPANTTATAAWTFRGWNQDANIVGGYANKETVSNLTATDGATVTLYATWFPNTITLPGATRTGYTFTGWYKNAVDPVLVGTAGESYMPTTNETLYAMWTANQYNIHYVLNGGTHGTYHPSVATFDERFPVSMPTRAGYTFTGWNVASGLNPSTARYGTSGAAATAMPIPSSATQILNGSDNVYLLNLTDVPGGTVVLNANWTANTYTVHYDGNGATGGSMSPSTHIINEPKTLSANAYKRSFNVIYNPNYSGMETTTVTVASTFNGWNTAANGSGTSYANQAPVTNLAAAGGSVTLYAQWTAGSTLLPTPERTGYTLVGWYSDSALTTLVGQGGAAYVPTANVTLYAKWTTHTYTVHFDGNGATGGSMSDQSFTYDVPQALTANAFTRVNTVTLDQNYAGCPANTTATAAWTFRGWSKNAEIVGGYEDQATVNNLTAANGATLTLYASWFPNTITLPMPTREGYTFAGWYRDAEGLTSAVSMTYYVAEDITLYAKWTKDEPVTSLKYVVPTVRGKAGRQVQLAVQVQDNPGIIATSLKVTYDNTKLCLTAVDNGIVFSSDVFTAGDNLTKIPFTTIWVDALTHSNIMTNGTIVTFTFEVLSDAADGLTPVTIEASSVFDVNMQAVPFTVTNGAIDVYHFILGDVNGDNEVDLRDAVELARWLAGWDVVIDEDAADINADGVIDLIDLVLLRRHLAGWDISYFA